jgi:transposase
MLDLSSLPRLGIDVSKLTFDAELCLDEHRRQRRHFANTAAGFAQLEAWLKDHDAKITLAGLEATGPYSRSLLAHLHDQGHHVCHLNPRRVKDFAKSQGWRVKTDRVDAGVLAAYLRCTERLQLWQPPAPEMAALQALVRRRQQVLTALQAERNRLEDSNLPALVTKSLQRQMRHLKSELAALSKAIADHVAQHKALEKSVRLLRSIPGVGPTVAVTLLAEVPKHRSLCPCP